MLVAGLVLFNKSVKISKWRKYVRRRKKGKDKSRYWRGKTSPRMDLLMRLDCCSLYVPWSEWQSQSWSFGDGGPQNKKFLGLCAFRSALENPDPPQGGNSSCLRQDWGMHHLLKESSKRCHGCFGVLGGLNPPLLVLPAPWPHFCTCTGGCVATMDLKSKTCTRRVLPYLGISHLNGYWCLRHSNPLTPYYPCPFSWVPG